MNKLVTGNIHAVRALNGDVWISRDGVPVHYISIPKEDCAELAKLLVWPVISDSHKVDYSKCVGEPE